VLSDITGTKTSIGSKEILKSKRQSLTSSLKDKSKKKSSAYTPSAESGVTSQTGSEDKKLFSREEESMRLLMPHHRLASRMQSWSTKKHSHKDLLSSRAFRKLSKKNKLSKQKRAKFASWIDDDREIFVSQWKDDRYEELADRVGQLSKALFCVLDQDNDGLLRANDLDALAAWYLRLNLSNRTPVTTVENTVSIDQSYSNDTTPEKQKEKKRERDGEIESKEERKEETTEKDDSTRPISIKTDLSINNDNSVKLITKHHYKDMYQTSSRLAVAEMISDEDIEETVDHFLAVLDPMAYNVISYPVFLEWFHEYIDDVKLESLEAAISSGTLSAKHLLGSITNTLSMKSNDQNNIISPNKALLYNRKVLEMIEKEKKLFHSNQNNKDVITRHTVRKRRRQKVPRNDDDKIEIFGSAKHERRVSFSGHFFEESNRTSRRRPSVSERDEKERERESSSRRRPSVSDRDEREREKSSRRRPSVSDRDERERERERASRRRSSVSSERERKRK